MSNEEGHIRVVARQAVCSMVGGHVEVSVDADRALVASRPHTTRRGPVGATVSVQMTGPDGAPHKHNRMMSAEAEASAWGIDEIVSAARRAADRILAENPTWRRTSA